MPSDDSNRSGVMGYHKSLDILRQIVYGGGEEAVAAAQYMMPQWIPVGERLPEEYVSVVVRGVFYSDCKVYIGQYCGRGWMMQSGRAWEYCWTPSHWMPIPALNDTNERSVASAGSQCGDAEIARLRLQSAHAEMELLRTAIRRLADQDATLSVCDGAVTVTMDATLTDEEREAVKLAAEWFAAVPLGDTLRGLLERLK